MNRLRVLLPAVICTVHFLAFIPTIQAQDIPQEVGGFKLGTEIGEYPDAMTTNFLKEMVITDWHGFRKGIISYGSCKYPNQIVRIEMKYEEKSKQYFQKLLTVFKAKYGPPDEWKGDSFGILHIWKWYFKDSEGRAISLLLQHNLRNPNESIGNVVKLTNSTMMNEERRCFNQMCDEQKSDADRQRLEKLREPDWQYLIPR